MLVSLPLTFVPFAALFDGDGIARRVRDRRCARSRATCRRCSLLRAISFALLLLGLATMGVGLVLALPWIAAASYAAWKDIFGLGAPRHG